MNEDKKFRGYIENEWLNMRANLKCFRPIKNYNLKHFPSWIVLYVWLGEKDLHPENHIKCSLN